MGANGPVLTPFVRRRIWRVLAVFWDVVWITVSGVACVVLGAAIIRDL